MTTRPNVSYLRAALRAGCPDHTEMMTMAGMNADTPSQAILNNAHREANQAIDDLMATNVRCAYPEAKIVRHNGKPVRRQYDPVLNFADEIENSIRGIIDIIHHALLGYYRDRDQEIDQLVMTSYEIGRRLHESLRDTANMRQTSYVDEQHYFAAIDEAYGKLYDFYFQYRYASSRPKTVVAYQPRYTIGPCPAGKQCREKWLWDAKVIFRGVKSDCETMLRDVVERLKGKSVNPSTGKQQQDGPQGGRWVWWQGTRHDVPSGVVYRLIHSMWNRDSLPYDDAMDGLVWDDSVTPQTVRSKSSGVNKQLAKIGVSWRITADSESRTITKANETKSRKTSKPKPKRASRRNP
jgi:hypothetical protein